MSGKNVPTSSSGQGPSLKPLRKVAQGIAWEREKRGCNTLNHCRQLSQGRLSEAAWLSGLNRAHRGPLPIHPPVRLLADSVSAPDSPLAH